MFVELACLQWQIVANSEPIVADSGWSQSYEDNFSKNVLDPHNSNIPGLNMDNLAICVPPSRYNIVQVLRNNLLVVFALTRYTKAK